MPDSKHTIQTVADDLGVIEDDADSAGDDAGGSPDIPEQFSIQDADSASWLLRRVNESRHHVRRVKDWASREIRRAEADERFLMLRYGNQLQVWTAQEIERLRGRRRSISLPGGTCGYRHINPSLVVDDEQAVIRWARANLPSAIVTVSVEKLAKDVINDHFESTGEVPSEGAHAVSAHDRFYIRTENT